MVDINKRRIMYCFKDISLVLLCSSFCLNHVFAQEPIPSQSPIVSSSNQAPANAQSTPADSIVHKMVLTPELQAAMQQVLKQHPDFTLIQKWTSEMIRGELNSHDHSGRDKLVAYARNASHDEVARAAAVDSISAIISDENLKLTASFLNDSSADVRRRAYYQLPREIQIGINAPSGNYDYTRVHSDNDFNLTLARAYKLIDAYTKGSKPRLNGQRPDRQN